MQIGIDSFVAAYDDATLAVDRSVRVRNVVEQIELADQVGLDSFGIGEHHRKEYLDSAPVRLFQQFATLDLVSNGRAEMVVGRGSFTEAFPLFGLSLDDHDSLFEEKLELLLAIRESERVEWSGKFRPALTGQGVYPRPVQSPRPVWIGVGGTPRSFARAGALGLPLMVAIIGGETWRFRPLIDRYRETAERFGHSPAKLKVGVHSLGCVAATRQQAADEFFPGYAKAIESVAKERGWGAVTRARFDAQLRPEGALLIGEPEEIAEKIIRHGEALGGVDRFTFQMNASSLPHAKLMTAIELLGTRVAPALRQGAPI